MYFARNSLHSGNGAQVRAKIWVSYEACVIDNNTTYVNKSQSIIFWKHFINPLHIYKVILNHKSWLNPHRLAQITMFCLPNALMEPDRTNTQDGTKIPNLLHSPIGWMVLHVLNGIEKNVGIQRYSVASIHKVLAGFKMHSWNQKER